MPVVGPRAFMVSNVFLSALTECFGAGSGEPISRPLGLAGSDRVYSVQHQETGFLGSLTGFSEGDIGIRAQAHFSSLAACNILALEAEEPGPRQGTVDRKSTRLNSSHI